eukprot:g47863.t1
MKIYVHGSRMRDFSYFKKRMLIGNLIDIFKTMKSLDRVDVLQLRDRLFHAQGEALVGQQPPTFPFSHVVTKGLFLSMFFQ